MSHWKFFDPERHQRLGDSFLTPKYLLPSVVAPCLSQEIRLSTALFFQLYPDLREGECYTGSQCSTGSGTLDSRTISVRHQQVSSPVSVSPITMNRAPPEQSVRAVLALCLPHVTLESLQEMRSPRLQCKYELVLSGGSRLALSLAPPSLRRLLRSEQWMIKSEAAVVAWIRDALSAARPDNPSPIPKEDGGDLFCIPRRTADRLPEGKCHEPLGYRNFDFVDLFPTLIRHSSTSKELGSPYNIYEPTEGIPVFFLEDPLTSDERCSVDFQIGKLLRRVSQLTPPSTKFGPAEAVLSTKDLQPLHTVDQGMVDPGGADTWSVAFNSMFEAILRDGEDMAVTLSYSIVRKHFRRLQHLLDFVQLPRLVVIDVFDDSNVLITRDSASNLLFPGDEHPVEVAKTQIKTCPGDEDEGAGDEYEQRRQTPTTTGETENTAGEDEDMTALSKQHGEDQKGILVTGLQDWSNCVFGDPLLATVFDSKPSQHFLRGFSGLEQGVELSESGLESSLVEDKEYADTRLLLYQVYHAVSCIVREFYRPQRESKERELAARRRLNKLLVKLGEIEVDPKRRHRRPTADMSPAKKSKSDDAEDWNKRPTKAYG